MGDCRVYGYIFTFEIENMTKSQKVNLYWLLDKHKIDAFFFTKGKITRVITIGSTRRKIESLMFDTKGKHLRILDDYTFGIMSDYIETVKLNRSKI